MIMKANVQHHDFFGSAAADISNNTNLQKFLESKRVDTTRYEAVGAGFNGGHEGSFSGFIICKDKQKSTEDRDHIIRLSFEEAISKDEFFSLFKRFEVLIASKDGGYGIAEVNGELIVSKDEA
ncbi:hypothetical protein [Pontibacter pamirensis]|uniref:hypothetical protein n=1 Tax=Pontibacter pamirensis TaxID=2562824 RepID=UPI001389FE56|nr:hypothetical protein [Pontibacter pamirensis]